MQNTAKTHFIFTEHCNLKLMFEKVHETPLPIRPIIEGGKKTILIADIFNCQYDELEYAPGNGAEISDVKNDAKKEFESRALQKRSLCVFNCVLFLSK